MRLDRWMDGEEKQWENEGNEGNAMTIWRNEESNGVSYHQVYHHHSSKVGLKIHNSYFCFISSPKPHC